MPRGSRPGERRGGRQKGTPNKATAELQDLARQYTPQTLKELVRLSIKAESEQARVSACREILDRGYGRPAQAVTGADGGPIESVTRVIHEESPDA